MGAHYFNGKRVQRAIFGGVEVPRRLLGFAAPVITAPTAAGALADQTFTQGTGVQTFDASGDFSNGGGTLAFSLPTKPSGVTIDGATGVISFDTATTAVVSGASVVVRAMNSAGSADSGFSLTINAAFAEVAGRVSTGTAQLSIGPVTGTDPAGMAFVGYFTAPAAGFGTSTVPWFTSADGTHQAYVSITAAGEAFASIYTRVGGALQAAQTIYFQGDPIQPGERFVLVGSGIAGGSFALRQSRAGADFVDAGSVTIPAGAVFPIYGQEHTFFGAPIISDGVFVFAYGALPGVLGSLAALNAGKASIVAAGGARPTIDTIKAALGTPVYAVYGPAATITANRGTAGGTYTKTGTITDYVPAAFSPTITNFDAPATMTKTLSGYTLDGTTHPRGMLIVDSFRVDEGGTPTNTAGFVQDTSAGNIPGAKLGADGGIVVLLSSTDGLGATQSKLISSTSGGSSGLTFAVGDIATVAVQIIPGGQMSAAISKSGGTWVAVGPPVAIPADYVPKVNQTWSLSRSVRSNDHGGFGVYLLDAAVDLLANPDAFVDASGWAADPALTRALVGSEPILEFYGTAADATALVNTGTGGPWSAKTGTITDVAPAFSEGFIATSDSDEALRTGVAADYSITEAVASSFGTTPFDYSGVALTVDSASVMLGEAPYFEVTGLTDEQRATWGFLWTFDTSGEFRYLSDLPWHMRQKNRAVGHHQTAAWETPGTKTVKVAIIPPAHTGYVMQIRSVDVTVRDPETEFAGVTVCVDTTGAFTAAPSSVAASERVTTWAAAYSKLKGWNGGRILLKRGQTVTLTNATSDIISENYSHGVMFDTWGNTADPLPVISTLTDGFNWIESSAPPFRVIRDIRFQGGYNGLTGVNAESQTVCTLLSDYGGDISFIGCESVNNEVLINIISPDELAAGKLSVIDCHVTAWENYGLYTASCGKVLVRGSYICQDPDFPVANDQVLQGNAKNLGGPINYADHGPIRLTKAENMRVVVAQMRMFSCNGWTTGGTAMEGSVTPMAHQPVLRLGALTTENVNALVTEVYSEGGGYTLGGGNSNYVVGSGFVAMHNCYLLHHASYNGIGGGATGRWVHSNVIAAPNVLRETRQKANRTALDPEVIDLGVTATWHTKPIYEFNNTILWMSAPENFGGDAITEYQLVTGTDTGSRASRPIYEKWDNALHCPLITLSGEGTPRVLSGLSIISGRFGPLPLYKGRHFIDNSGVEFGPWTQNATPVDAPVMAAIGSTSEVRGAATGQFTPALDFFGRIRAERDQGALAHEVLKPAV